jgi:hypothetical protein
MFSDVPNSSVENGPGRVGSQARLSYFYMVRVNKSDTVPVSEIIDNLKEISEKYVFQLERGSTGIEHYQLMLKLKTKKRRETLRNWLNENLFLNTGTHKKYNFPNGAYCEVVKSWIKAANYCCKEDTRVGEVYSHNIFLKKKMVFPELYDWQKKVVKEIEKGADDRSIIHVNKNYCSGKSMLGKYLIVNYDALIVDGKETHILALVAGRPDVKIIVMDCAADNSPVAWSAIEKIKNGYFASHFGTKGTKMILLEHKVHIIIFSNNSLEKDLKKRKIDKNRFIKFTDADDEAYSFEDSEESS